MSDSLMNKAAEAYLGLDMDLIRGQARKSDFRAGWLAALAAVEAKMPPRTDPWKVHAQGWNQYQATMSERIAALREETK